MLLEGLLRSLMQLGGLGKPHGFRGRLLKHGKEDAGSNFIGYCYRTLILFMPQVHLHNGVRV